MNQQHQGSGSSNPSSVPVKRKRGRPRKEESSAAQGDNTPVRRGSDNIVNSSQTEVTTGGADNEMLGKVVTGVIEGSFGAGYLLNVRVGDTQTYLKGAVFLPGRYDPVTPENDVAPHLKMLERKEFPIPVLNPQAQMQSSIPSSGQGSKQPVEPKLPVLNAQDQVLPSEIHSVTSVSLENQSDSVALPIANKPKNDTSISEGGKPQQLSEPGYVSQPPSIMSEMGCDKVVEQDVTLNKLDACRQLKEHGTDGGAEKDSEPTPEAMDLLPTTKIKDKELLTGQQAGSSLQMSNQQIQDEPKNANIKLNQMPVSAESESMQSEQILDQINDSSILNQMSVTAEPVPMQSEQIHEEPKDPDIILNEMAVSSEPEPMQSEQTHDEPKNSDIILNQVPITSEPEPKQSKEFNDEPKNSDIQLNQMPVSPEPESMKSEQIHDEPKKSNIQLNQMPLSAEPEFMHSEHIDELKNSHIELNQMPVSAEPEPMQPVDKFVKQDSPKPAPETSDPTTLFEGVAARSESEFASEGSNLPTLLEGEAARSESKFASEGSNLPGINDPSGEITKEDDKQPNESFVKSVEPENPIGPDNL